MGSRFEYVADEALSLVISSMMPKCHLCKQMVEEIFNYPEDVVLPDGTEDDIRQVCEPCLRAGPKVRENPWLLKAVRKHFPRKRDASALAQALARFARTPRPDMPQGTDWPLCCGDFCELYSSGDDEDISKQTAGMEMWDWGPVRIPWAKKIAKGEPEFGDDLMFFRCPRCSQRYFTFQPT